MKPITGATRVPNHQNTKQNPFPSERKPLVSIVVPNFNGKRLLKECLDSIENLRYRNYEVIVVDNSSTDGSIEMVKKNYPRVRLLVTERMSMACACNRGLALARGEVIVPMLNNDLIVERYWLDHLVGALQQKEVGVVGGKIYRCETTVLNSAGNMIYWSIADTQGIGRGELDVGQFDTPRDVDYVEFPTVRKDVNCRIGPIDEGYFHYFLDVDYCTTAKEMGYKVMYIPGAVAWHHEAATIGFNTLRYFYSQQRDSLRFLLKHSPASMVFYRFWRWSFHMLVLSARNLARRRIDLVMLQLKAFTWNILRLNATRRSRRVG